MIKEIKKYSGFIENSLKEQYAYKFRAFIWAIFSVFSLFIQYFLWKAVFEGNNGVIYNITLKQYITYLGIGMIVNLLTTCYIYFDIGEDVKNGNLAANLIKPYSFRRKSFATHIGAKLGELINLIPMLFVIIFITGVTHVPVIIFLEFLFSVFISFLLMFLFAYFLGMLTFWITNYWGLHFLKISLESIFSGQLIAIYIFVQIGAGGIKNTPLPFISTEFITVFFRILGYIAYMLPFQAIYYTPTAIYTGLIEGKNVISHILLQLFWLVLIYILTNFTWKKAQDKITIFGG